ncbi:MAG: alpha/beta hydrolase, partial [Anaerolineales bacterium]|nr:alpha/beta hydrolase [Anaerolineales bacterium]
MNKLKKYWWLVVLIVIMAVGGGVYYWLSDSLPPMPEALAALQSDTAVTVETDPWYVFQPNDVQPTTGFIFYPGGKVDPRAYAPPAHALAAAGYLVV